MELNKVAEEYEVSEELLIAFVKGGLFNDYSGLCGEKAEQQKLSSCICLYALGLDISTIKEYLRLEQLGKKGTQGRIKILRKVRKKALDELHHSKEALDCIDSIIIEIKLNK